MNSKSFIYILIFLVFGHFNASSQTLNYTSDLVLFTDRDFCMSGDTVWFKVCLPDSIQQKENVIRVQLDGKGNNLISNVIKKAENSWAEGFISVPDSLSTGQYFVTAFINSQRNLSDLTFKSKSLLVYNRFEERVSEMDLLARDSFVENIDRNFDIKIESNKEKYASREKVTVNFGFEEEINNVLVRASIVDPLTKEFSGDYKFKLKPSNNLIPDFAEKDGFLISGRVVDAERIPQKGVLVLMSITGEPPYFDYYLSGKDGDFHFFLKNAFGKANIVIQAISGNQNEYFIEQEANYLEKQCELSAQTKILTLIQSEFISTLIKGNFIDRLFRSSNLIQTEYFEMPPRFGVPFYGPPTERVLPDEFIDLPNFNEISKELLFGVQYRNRKGNITIRMINDSQSGGFFINEPLRLLNGIPIFNNSLFSTLNSKDINYIDIVQKERIFGVLSFKGILAVSLHDKSNIWLNQQANIFQFKINCLQPGTEPEYLSVKEINKSTLDSRQVYYWEVIKSDSLKEIEFFLSDLKGEVEISVEGMTAKNKMFRASKTIEVK